MVVLNNSEKKPKTIDLQGFSEMLSDVSRGRDILSGREIKDLSALPDLIRLPWL